MKTHALLAALLAAACCPLFAATPSDDPRTLGPVALKELSVREGKVVVRVASGGCTEKASLKATVQREKGPSDKVPQVRITFERVRPDACKALLLDGVVLEYDLAKDFGLSAACDVVVTNPVVQRGAAPDATGSSGLRQGLIDATVRALALERKGYEEKLRVAEKGVGPADNAARFKARLAEIDAWSQKYGTMDPSQYALPKPGSEPPPELDSMRSFGPKEPAQTQVVKATLQETCREGSTLEVEGMTKSGPFYHVAGIAGGDYGKLKVGTSCEVTLYLVYRREYVGSFPSYYVFIADWK